MRKGIKIGRWGEDSRYNNKNSISISGAELYSGGIRNLCGRGGGSEGETTVSTRQVQTPGREVKVVWRGGNR